MFQHSRFFDPTEGDNREYAADDFAQFFTNFLGNGFFNGLSISANDSMTVTVSSGAAFIEGYQYTNGSSLDLTLDSADSTQDRIDRVVLRLDKFEGRYIRAFVKKGETATNPVPPELTRNDYFYELSLAQIKVTAGKSYIDSTQITDERGDHDVCGRVQVARTVQDQINTVDVRQPSHAPDRYAEGIVQFYTSGDNLALWLGSIDIDYQNIYGRSSDQLRAYVHTVANRTNTAVQEITIFDWAYQRNYQIYGVFRRASNAIGASVAWGDWVEIPVVVDSGTFNQGNGRWKKYSDGWMTINFQDTEELRTNTTSGALYYNLKRFDYPQSFIERPIVTPVLRNIPGSSYVQFPGVRTLTATYVEIYQICTTADRPGLLGYKAEGRWR